MMFEPVKRPIPDDFADVADKLFWKWDALGEHYKAGYTTVKRWVDSPGMPERKASAPKEQRVKVPDDFATYAPGKTHRDLRDHYKICSETLRKWRKITGVEPLYTSNNPAGRHGLSRSVPADFAEAAKTMTSMELRKHYNCGHNTLDRWRKESGIKPLRFSLAERKKSTANAGTWRPQLMRGFKSTAERSYGIYDEAADIMRKYGPCYRCGPTGVFLEKGLHWRFGNTVMTGEELLAKATRYRAKAA